MILLINEEYLQRRLPVNDSRNGNLKIFVLPNLTDSIFTMEECGPSDLIQALNEVDEDGDNVSVDSVQLMAEINEFINESESHNFGTSSTKHGIEDKKKASIEEPSSSKIDSAGPSREIRPNKSHHDGIKLNQPFVVLEKLDASSEKKKCPVKSQRTESESKKSELKSSVWQDDDASLSELSVSDFSISDSEDVEDVPKKVSESKRTEEKIESKMKKASKNNSSGNEIRKSRDEPLTGSLTTDNSKNTSYNSRSKSSANQKSSNNSNAVKKNVKSKDTNIIMAEGSVIEQSKTENKKHENPKKEAQKSSTKDINSDKPSKADQYDTKKRNEPLKPIELNSSENTKNWRYELFLSNFSFLELNNESFRKFINLAADCAFEFDQLTTNKSCEGVNLYFGDYAAILFGMQKLGQVSFTSSSKVKGLIVARQMNPMSSASTMSSAATGCKGRVVNTVRITFTLHTAWTDKLKQLVQVKDWKKGDKRNGKNAKILQIPSVVSKEILSLLFPFSLDIHFPVSHNTQQETKSTRSSVDVEFANTELMEAVLCCFQEQFIYSPSSMLPSFKVLVSNFKPLPLPPGHKNTNVNAPKPPSQNEHTRQGRLFPCQIVDKRKGHGSSSAAATSTSNRDRKRPMRTTEERTLPSGKRSRFNQPDEGHNVTTDQPSGEKEPSGLNKNLEEVRMIAQAQGLDPNNSDVLCILELQRQLESMQSLMAPSTSVTGHGSQKSSQAGLLPTPQSGVPNREKELAQAEQKLRENIAFRQRQLQELEEKLKANKNKISRTKDNVNKTETSDVTFKVPGHLAPPPNQNDQPLDFKKPEPKVEQLVKADEVRSKLSAIGNIASAKKPTPFTPQHMSLKAEDCALPLSFGKNVEKVSPKVIERKTSEVIGKKGHSQERFEFGKGDGPRQMSRSSDRSHTTRSSRERRSNRFAVENTPKYDVNSQGGDFGQSDRRPVREERNSPFLARPHGTQNVLESEKDTKRPRLSGRGGFGTSAERERDPLMRGNPVKEANPGYQRDSAHVWSHHNVGSEDFRSDQNVGRSGVYDSESERRGKHPWKREGRAPSKDKLGSEYNRFYPPESDGPKLHTFGRSSPSRIGIGHVTGQARGGGALSRGGGAALSRGGGALNQESGTLNQGGGALNQGGVTSTRGQMSPVMSRGASTSYNKDKSMLGQLHAQSQGRENYWRETGGNVLETSMSENRSDKNIAAYYTSYTTVTECEGKRWNPQEDRFHPEHEKKQAPGQESALQRNRGGRGGLHNKTGGLHQESETSSLWNDDVGYNDHYFGGNVNFQLGEVNTTKSGKYEYDHLKHGYGKTGTDQYREDERSNKEYSVGNQWNQSKADWEAEPVGKHYKQGRVEETPQKWGEQEYGGDGNFDERNKKWYEDADDREAVGMDWYNEPKEEYQWDGQSSDYGNVKDGGLGRGRGRGNLGGLGGKRTGDRGNHHHHHDRGFGNKDVNVGEVYIEEAAKIGGGGRGFGGISRERGDSDNQGGFGRGRGRGFQKGFAQEEDISRTDNSYAGNQRQQHSRGRGLGQSAFGRGQEFETSLVEVEDDRFSQKDNVHGYREEMGGRSGFATRGGRGGGNNDTKEARRGGFGGGVDGGFAGRGGRDQQGRDGSMSMPNNKPGLLGALPSTHPEGFVGHFNPDDGNGGQREEVGGRGGFATREGRGSFAAREGRGGFATREERGGGNNNAKEARRGGFGGGVDGGFAGRDQQGRDGSMSMPNNKPGLLGALPSTHPEGFVGHFNPDDGNGGQREEMGGRGGFATREERGGFETREGRGGFATRRGREGGNDDTKEARRGGFGGDGDYAVRGGRYQQGGDGSMSMPNNKPGLLGAPPSTHLEGFVGLFNPDDGNVGQREEMGGRGGFATRGGSGRNDDKEVRRGFGGGGDGGLRDEMGGRGGFASRGGSGRNDTKEPWRARLGGGGGGNDSGKQHQQGGSGKDGSMQMPNNKPGLLGAPPSTHQEGFVSHFNPDDGNGGRGRDGRGGHGSDGGYPGKGGSGNAGRDGGYAGRGGSGNGGHGSDGGYTGRGGRGSDGGYTGIGGSGNAGRDGGYTGVGGSGNAGRDGGYAGRGGSGDGGRGSDGGYTGIGGSGNAGRDGGYAGRGGSGNGGSGSDGGYAGRGGSGNAGRGRGNTGSGGDGGYTGRGSGNAGLGGYGGGDYKYNAGRGGSGGNTGHDGYAGGGGGGNTGHDGYTGRGGGGFAGRGGGGNVKGPPSGGVNFY